MSTRQVAILAWPHAYNDENHAKNGAAFVSCGKRVTKLMCVVCGMLWETSRRMRYGRGFRV